VEEEARVEEGEQDVAVGTAVGGGGCLAMYRWIRSRFGRALCRELRALQVHATNAMGWIIITGTVLTEEE